ncbi:MAG: transcriptional regulator GcvA [Pseudomonadota bacterium]
MSRRLPPLNWLKAFEAAARHLSFKKAGAELNVSPSAISHHVRELEERLGGALFERRNREIRLSESGSRLYPGLKDGFDRLAEAMARLQPDTPDNVLVVSTGPAFAAKWLAPRVYRFVERYPEIELRIAANLKLIDFAEDKVDVAIRFGGGDYPGVAVDKLFDDFVVPMMSPAYRVGGRAIERPADLVEATLLHDDSLKQLDPEGGWVRWFRHAGLHGGNALRGPRFTHADHAIDAAIDAAGVVLGRLALARRDLRDGRLVAPFGPARSTGFAFWLAYPPLARERDKVAAFKAWIDEECTLYEAEDPPPIGPAA